MGGRVLAELQPAGRWNARGWLDGPGNLCLFAEIQGQNDTALVIFPVLGQPGEKTQIFYAR